MLKDLKKIHALKESGLSWQDLKHEYGVNDNVRKMYYGYKEAIDSALSSDKVLHEQRLKLKQLKKDLSIERQIVNQDVKYLAEHKRIQEELLSPPKLDHSWEPRRKYEKGDTFWVLTLSDWHYDGSQEMIDATMPELTQSIIDTILDNGISNIYIAELGDTIEGAGLRTSQLAGIKKGMIQQSIEAGEAYKKMFETIHDVTGVNIFYIGVSSSNHTQLRLHGSKKNDLPDEDVMRYIHDRVKDSEGIIDYQISDEVIMNLEGFNFYFTHGHMAKGPKKELSDKSQYHGVMLDFGFMGHYHHFEVHDLHRRRGYDARMFVCPTLHHGGGQFEKDRNLSSARGYGLFKFDTNRGNISSQKVVF